MWSGAFSDNDRIRDESFFIAPWRTDALRGFFLPRPSGWWESEALVKTPPWFEPRCEGHARSAFGGHYGPGGDLIGVASIGVLADGVPFAYWLPGIVARLEIFEKISAMMGIAFWLGLFWRRTTVAWAWAATLLSFFA